MILDRIHNRPIAPIEDTACHVCMVRCAANTQQTSYLEQNTYQKRDYDAEYNIFPIHEPLRLIEVVDVANVAYNRIRRHRVA